MATNKKRTNRRMPVTGKWNKLYSLVIVVILLCVALLFLEWLKNNIAEIPKSPKVVEERQKLPPRQQYAHVEMQPYTSAVSGKKAGRRGKPLTPGTVAIIIDDMGTTVKEAESLMAINVPLTFSLIPGLPKAREVSRIAHEHGYQVMIHIPMEPKGYPKQRLEDNGLLMSQTEDEIEMRVNSYLKQVPNAAGANNHMGSRFSEDTQKMWAVLKQLKANGLFYVDSRTTPNSVGLQLARSIEMDSAGRNVFLDNVQDIDAITAQLEQLASLARKKGSAIGICHPHKITIQALAMNLPILRAQGISFVSAGDIVR